MLYIAQHCTDTEVTQYDASEYVIAIGFLSLSRRDLQLFKANWEEGRREDPRLAGTPAISKFQSVMYACNFVASTNQRMK